MHLCPCWCSYYEGQKKCFTGKLRVPPPPPSDTKENWCWLLSSCFMGTHSQLDLPYLWHNRSSCMEYQSLNPGFPFLLLTSVTRLHAGALPWTVSTFLKNVPYSSYEIFKSCHYFVFQLHCSTKSCSAVSSFWTPRDRTNFSENAFENATKGFIFWYLPSAS